MPTTVGVFGNAAIDRYVSVRSVQRREDHVEIALASGTIVSFGVSASDSKVTLERIPLALEQAPAKTIAGGGNINSTRAAHAIASKHSLSHDRIRCLDANESHPILKRGFSGPIQFLGIRPAPHNYVFGDRHDKLIARSAIAEAMRLSLSQKEQIDSFCEAQSMLLNSAKDRVAVEAIFDRKAITNFDVISVMTPSLNPAFYTRVVIPRSNVAIAAWDELEFLLGHNASTVEETIVAVARLRRWGEAELHVTMGKRGVITLAEGSFEPWHIELTSGAAAAVQRIVAAFPERLCGAGDAYASGVLMQRGCGLSQMSHSETMSGFPLHVRSALAGCASALAHIGFRPASPIDFHVQPLKISAFAMTG